MIPKSEKMKTKKSHSLLRNFVPAFWFPPLIFQKMILPTSPKFLKISSPPPHPPTPPSLQKGGGMKLEGGPQDINRYVTNAVFRTLSKKNYDTDFM